MEPIRIVDVCKSFGPMRAVDGLTMTVPEGAAHGFLGPNEVENRPPSESCLAWRNRTRAPFGCSATIRGTTSRLCTDALLRAGRRRPVADDDRR